MRLVRVIVRIRIRVRVRVRVRVSRHAPGGPGGGGNLADHGVRLIDHRLQLKVVKRVAWVVT